MAQLQPCRRGGTMSRTAEKLMRILTLPPLVAILTAALLWVGAGLSRGEFLASVFFLGLVPLLAYPLWELFPNREDRRSGQRTYALYCSVAGYAAGFVCSLTGQHSLEFRVLFASYVLSVLVLIVLSKVARFKISGHACSSTAPLVMMAWKPGPALVPLGLAILFAVYYSSLRLGRHTFVQLLAGSSVSLAAAMGSIMLFCA